MSSFYRYDWLLTPLLKTLNYGKKGETISNATWECLGFLENLEIKHLLNEIAHDVIIDGSYYGYLIRFKDGAVLQKLPMKYCRTREKQGNREIVELNMKMFDDLYPDVAERYTVLKNMPKEFMKGYKLYFDNKLPPRFRGDRPGWYSLDVNCGFKFSITSNDYPFFAQVLPALLDLEVAQELDRKKMAQKLIKIIVQKLPLDKNGDLIFDVDEIKDLHKNAVKMLGQTIGIDVLTTMAEVSIFDLADKSTVTSIDELDKVERSLFNEAGSAQNNFNPDGNIALEKSIVNDELSIYDLILQFQTFLNVAISDFNKKYQKTLRFKVDILPTTAYNYKEMAKLYKEQVALGYSKMLPQVALGQSQYSIVSTAVFENQILDLPSLLVPPMSSNTMSSKVVGSENKGGRTEKSDDEKSEKTIANKESMS